MSEYSDRDRRIMELVTDEFGTLNDSPSLNVIARRWILREANPESPMYDAAREAVHHDARLRRERQ